MWGSSVIDTVIGVVFVFLLVSLLVTIGNELIAAALQSRAKWLRIGIEQLLGSEWGQRLYQHPLVYGTAKSGTGPSYIPSRTFANVLTDLLRDGDAAVNQARAALQAALGGAAGAGAGVDGLKAGLLAAAAQAAPLSAAGRRLAADLARLHDALPATVGAAVAEVQKFIDTFPARYVRELIEDVPDERIRKPLLALFDDAQNDVEKFKQNVEIWFNNAMDRVGGWYKRRAQWVTLGIGLALAAALNVDTVLVARHLQTDPGVRSALVAEAQAYALAAPSPLRAAGGAQALGDDGTQLPAQFREVRAELGKLGLPIGWVRNPSASQLQGGQALPGFTLPALADALAYHWLGWLITALAATLGAPFWFDTLNRLMSIRSAGKAPEEAPKPPKEVPVPLEPGQSPKEAEAAHG